MKSNKVKTAFRMIAGITVLQIVLLLYLTGIFRSRNGESSGIPDAVSSVRAGEKCSVTVVADREEIADEEAFAREVMRMCRENSFRSLRFSTDMGEVPKVFEIDVYLHREDMGECSPVFRIRAEREKGTDMSGAENQTADYQIRIMKNTD